MVKLQQFLAVSFVFLVGLFAHVGHFLGHAVGHLFRHCGMILLAAMICAIAVAARAQQCGQRIQRTQQTADQPVVVNQVQPNLQSRAVRNVVFEQSAFAPVQQFAVSDTSAALDSFAIPGIGNSRAMVASVDPGTCQQCQNAAVAQTGVALVPATQVVAVKEHQGLLARLLDNLRRPNAVPASY